MTGFEPQTSDIRSDHSSNSTTATYCLLNLLKLSSFGLKVAGSLLHYSRSYSPLLWVYG